MLVQSLWLLCFRSGLGYHQEFTRKLGRGEDAREGGGSTYKVAAVAVAVGAEVEERIYMTPINLLFNERTKMA